MPEGPINHLSYSQISTYLMCGLRYKFQYVDLIPPAFTASSLVFGQAIHEAVGAFYRIFPPGTECGVCNVLRWLAKREMLFKCNIHVNRQQ